MRKHDIASAAERSLLTIASVLTVTAPALAAANRLQLAGEGLISAVGVWLALAAFAVCRRNERLIVLICSRNAAVRFVAVFMSGVALSFLALFSIALPTSLVFDAVAWPVATMLWFFPPPCFGYASSGVHWCEGMPVQVLAGGVGVVILLFFYWIVSWFVVNRLVANTRCVITPCHNKIACRSAAVPQWAGA